MTPLSQTYGEKQQSSAFKVGPHLSFLKPSILRKTLPWPSKKNCPFTFLCIPRFQTKSNKAVNIFCRLPEWIRNVQMIPGFSTRLGWECELNSCMGKSKDWRSEK